MELKITAEKVRAAAAKCSTAKQTLETLFPEAFEEDKKRVLFKKFTGIISDKEERLIENRYGCEDYVVWLSGDFDWKMEKLETDEILLSATRKTN